MNDPLKPVIGSKWLTRDPKNPRLCTVDHVLTTTDETGKFVAIQYESSHEFMGQRIVHVDGATTVRMGIDRILKFHAESAA